MAPIIVYEKKTCITCKKALAFLDEQGIAYERKDIVQDPPDEALLSQVVDEANPKASLNVRSSLYKEKNLGKANLGKSELIDLMRQDPNLIKRPLIVNTKDNTLYQGFDPDTLADFLKH